MMAILLIKFLTLKNGPDSLVHQNLFDLDSMTVSSKHPVFPQLIGLKKVNLTNILARYIDGTGGCDGCLNWHGMEVRCV